MKMFKRKKTLLFAEYSISLILTAMIFIHAIFNG